MDSFHIGGTETQAVELALRMSAAGHRVTLGALRAQGPLLDRLRRSAVAIEEFYPRGGLDSARGLRELLRLSWYLRRNRFEIVHTHDLWSNLMGVVAARLASVPAIVSSRRDLSHSEWYQGRRRIWLKRIQNLSGAVLVNSTVIRDALVTQDGFAQDKIRVIYNGIDAAEFGSGRNLRQTLFPGLDGCKLVVLVGNMHTDVKGHPWLIAAAPAVLLEFPSARFVLVGDGEQRLIFERQAADLALQDKFRFFGQRSDIAQILGCCDLAVLPSRAEGFPNALLEYLASGLPVVASRLGGIPEMIQDGITGVLVPSESATALSSAIVDLLRDPQRAARIAAAGQSSALQRFSFDRLIHDLDALYTELLQRAVRSHAP